ncbi:MAG TPA: J domain-containing protein [Roseiarcus sp.]|nr:J domain-containing protein [Roseiarcus sp.]
MWKFLLDPVFQALAFLLTLAALAFVAWDLYDSARDPTPAGFAAPRRQRKRDTAPQRQRVHVEPSVEMWTDGQGETRGRVRRGPCRGMKLEDMSREQCDAQTAYARDHDPGAAVGLESFIRHKFGTQRRYEARPAGALTRAEALAELGLSDGATAAQIHAAYLALIKQHHPDRGGSHARAARLNQAKELLAG